MPGSTHSFKCPDCGAVIPFDGTRPSPAPAEQRAGPTCAAPRVTVSAIPIGPVARPSIVGCLMPVLLATGIVAFTVWRLGQVSFGSVSPVAQALGTTATNRTRMLQPGRLLPLPGGNDQLFAIARNYGGSQYPDALVRYDVTTGARAWEQAGTYQSQFTADAARVFLSSKSRLTAHDRASGRVLWQVNLADEIHASCDECLAVVGSRVVARTRDDTLQMFDAATGRIVFSRALGRPNRLAVFDDRLLVIAPRRTGAQVDATVIDADGRDERTFPVRCAAEWGAGALGWSDFTWVDAPAHALLAWYEGGCVQRYDLDTGRLTSSAATSRSASFGSAPAVVSGAGVLYLGEGENLHALPLDGGRPTRLMSEADFSLRPIGASAGVVAVRARRTRGTEHFELWGVDARNGRRLWQITMRDGARPMDPPDEFNGTLARDRDDSAFAAHVDGTALRVVRAGGRSGLWVSVESVDLATGTATGEARLPIEASDHVSAPRVFAWRGPVAWLLLDGRATAIDTAAGTVIARIP